MATKFTPLVLSSDGKQHIAAPQDAAIDTSHLVSAQEDNIITTGSDEKLYAPKLSGGDAIDIKDNTVSVVASDLVSSEPRNFLTSEENALYVTLDGGFGVAVFDDGSVAVDTDELAPGLVSQAHGNKLSVAVDGKLYADATTGAELISGADDNAMVLDEAGKLYVPPVVPSDMISGDAGNELTAGTDGGVYFKSKAVEASSLLSAADDNLLGLGNDGKLTVDGNGLLSNGAAVNLLTINEVDKRLQVDADDVADVIVDKITVVSSQSGNIISKGYDNGAYLSEDMLPDQVSEGEGVVVTDGKVSINVGTGLKVDKNNRLTVDEDALSIISVSATDRILSLTDDRVLTATVSADYDGNTGYLHLYGKNDDILSSIYIPGATSALKNVEIVEDPEGYAEGRYFKYTFQLSTGEMSILYVPVPIDMNLVEGHGIAVTVQDDIATVSVKVKPDGGLTADNSGLYVSGNYADKTELSNLSDKVDGIDELLDKVEAADVSTEIGSKIAALEGSVNTIEGKIVNFANLSIADEEPAELPTQSGVLFPAEDLL